LIKKEETPLFQLESFEGTQKKSQNQGDRPPGNSTGSVRFPLAGGLHGGEDPREKRVRLEKEAYEKGFEQGRKDGLALEKRQMEEKGKQLDALLSEISQLKRRICSESEGELLKLSILIAKRIIREEVKIDSHIIGKTIHSALKYLVDKSHIRILISPDDMEEVRQILPDLAILTKGGQFQLIEDNAIERGGCILETGFGRINATIEDELGMVEKEIEQEFKSHQGGLQ